MNVLFKDGIYNFYKESEVIMYILRIIAYIFVVIGAINWGLVGFFGFDLVASIFGEMSVASRVVYSLVGISALIFMLLSRDIFYHSDI